MGKLRITTATKYKNGQAAQMNKLVKQVIMVASFGVFWLIMAIGSSLMMAIGQAEQLRVTMALNQYRLGSKALTAAVQSYAASGNESYYDAYMQELNTDKNRDKALEILTAAGLKDSEWEGLNQIASFSDGLVPLEEQALADAKKGNLEAARASVFSSTYEQTVDDINRLTDEVISTIQGRIQSNINVMQFVNVFCMLLLVVSVVAVFLMFVKTIRFSRDELLFPIEKVSDQMEYLAEGDFSKKLEMEGGESEVGKMVESIAFMKKNMSDMVGEISTVLEQMGGGNYHVDLKQNYVGEFKLIKESMLIIIEKMKEVLNTLKIASDEINLGSEQLACAAQDLAEGSTTQATQMSELVTVIKQMAVDMENNAREADASVELAAEAGAALEKSNSKMEELKTAIHEISVCSEQIGTIISTIEDIASQTNLLSLNAAIEAARAGEAGRGFAVVAEQVKKLAEESSAAAGRTNKLIEDTIQAVDKGIGIADATMEDMVTVMGNAKAATEKMGQIADILGEEVRNMKEINNTINMVSEVVDSNSATSEETAAVSEEQKAQVEQMVDLISYFEV